MTTPKKRYVGEESEGDITKEHVETSEDKGYFHYPYYGNGLKTSPVTDFKFIWFIDSELHRSVSPKKKKNGDDQGSDITAKIHLGDKDNRQVDKGLRPELEG